jgi:hypothetical protein
VVELSMSKYYAENGFVKVMLEEMEPGGETR